MTFTFGIRLYLRLNSCSRTGILPYYPRHTHAVHPEPSLRGPSRLHRYVGVTTNLLTVHIASLVMVWYYHMDYR